MCARAGCSRVGLPTAGKRCPECRFVTTAMSLELSTRLREEQARRAELASIAGNGALIAQAADAMHAPVIGACVVKPPGGNHAGLKALAVGVALINQNPVADYVATGATYAMIKNHSRNATEIGRLVTERMALALADDGFVVFEMHPKEMLVRKNIVGLLYTDVRDIRVEPGREPMVIVLLRSNESFRLGAPGNTDNNAVAVFNLLKQKVAEVEHLPSRLEMQQAASAQAQNQYQAPRPSQPEAPASPAAAASQVDALERLERLAALHQAGHLTADEFAAQKAKLLDLL
jgi:hypothetical protein